MGRRGEGGIGRGARERDVVDVVVHLLPRPATLAGRAVNPHHRPHADLWRLAEAIARERLWDLLQARGTGWVRAVRVAAPPFFFGSHDDDTQSDERAVAGSSPILCKVTQVWDRFRNS